MSVHRLSIVAALMLLSPVASAFSGGISSASLGASGCNQCHGGGSVPTVAITGPASLVAGAQGIYTFTVTTTGSQDKAGLNAAASAGVLAVAGGSSSGTQATTGAGNKSEITHAGFKQSVGGTTTFTFGVTAPASGGSVTLSVWGNAVDGMSGSSGDAAAKATKTITVTCPDNDGDSFTASTCGGTDCNDGNKLVFPGATEACNGVDDNCNSQTDEGVTTTYYADVDGDTFGNPNSSKAACTQPLNYVANKLDCNDGDKNASPNGVEICNNADDNCNTLIDDGVPTQTYYADVDGDTFGDVNNTKVACALPFGYVTNKTDCNDGIKTISPAGTEVCNLVDDNCNAVTDEGVQLTFFQDFDSDTFGNVAVTKLACTAPLGYVANQADCDDQSALIKPTATEKCNGLDDNCNTSIDEGVPTQTYYADVDGDTFGNAASTKVACSQPVGYVSDKTDCDDTTKLIRPTATETCNLIDDNCSGATDEGVQTTFFEDFDDDTFGSALVTKGACTVPTGYVANNKDCDDKSTLVSPLATESCNNVDDNCNAQIDEAGGTVWYRDLDTDGFGDVTLPVTACKAPLGYVAEPTDCNDDVVSVNPSAKEQCNSVDDNCNGQTDDGVVTLTFYADTDGDTWGDPAVTKDDCKAPSGYVARADDCNDEDETVSPSAVEVCNTIDDDCDSATDEDVQNTYFVDSDGDGYGDGNKKPVLSCSAPQGTSAEAGDCDDGALAVFPTASETANGVDDNCDGTIDEGTSAYDDDGDTFSEATGDCNDKNADISPEATEVQNGLDDDCDGTTDEGTNAYDDDGDGFSEDQGDCDDVKDTVYPTASEAIDATDNDCDGLVDEGTTAYDDDNDTYSEADGDCDDTTALVSPAATEVDDDIDNDCDGETDEGFGVVDADLDESPASEDCDDTNPDIYPGAPELENGVDDDCDGDIDEGSASADDDGDGVSEKQGDCDDANGDVHPGAPELENGVDDDCDGTTDDGTAAHDDDGDGASENEGDCNDENADIGKGAVEVDNGIDDDCDGVTDETVATDGTDATDSTDGATDGTDGATDGTDGATDVTDGTDGVTDATDGATDATDGATDGSGATDSGADGTDGLSDGLGGLDAQVAPTSSSGCAVRNEGAGSGAAGLILVAMTLTLWGARRAVRRQRSK